MIKVCDKMCGNGKTEASITYMNEHPHEKFIYITPFLNEAERIKESCPTLRFVEPSDDIEEFHFRKSEHTAHLIHLGRNIATTHQAFKRYTPEMLHDIREKGYRLIIDENMDVLEEYDIHPDDIEIALKAGYIEERNGTYHLVNEDYSGRALKELFEFLRVRELICIQDENRVRLYYWVLPADLITSFKEVIILTYMFEGQSLHHFLKMNDLPYEKIGINLDKNGCFSFGEYPGYVPEYLTHLKDMVDVVMDEKLNAIGDSRTALSMSWFENNPDGVERLRKNIDNVFRNKWKSVPGSKKMWGTYISQKKKLSCKGYKNSYLVWNQKSTNEWRDRYCLVYASNIFMNVAMKTFYQKNGIEVDEDLYALSILVQWIWRSAIRDGDKIHIYLPSRRMRELFFKWMDCVAEGSDIIAEAS